MTWAFVEPTPLRLSPDHQQAIEDLLDACTDWEAGRLPLPAVMSLGGLRTPAYTRYLAARSTPLDDPRRQALMRLLDATIRAEGWVDTRQGVYGRYEIAEHDRLFDRAALDRSPR